MQDSSYTRSPSLRVLLAYIQWKPLWKIKEENKKFILCNLIDIALMKHGICTLAVYKC